MSFGRYPAFHTLTSVGRKKLFSMSRNVAAFSCCIKVLNFWHIVVLKVSESSELNCFRKLPQNVNVTNYLSYNKQNVSVRVKF